MLPHHSSSLGVQATNDLPRYHRSRFMLAFIPVTLARQVSHMDIVRNAAGSSFPPPYQHLDSV